MKEICVQTIYVTDLTQALDFYTQALGAWAAEQFKVMAVSRF